MALQLSRAAARTSADERTQAPDLERLRRVSWPRILKHDNPAFLLATFGTVLFAYSLLVLVTGHTPGGRGRPSKPVTTEDALGFLTATGTLMVFLCSLAGLRVWRVLRLFRIGEPAQATVETISHAKGYSKLRFGYQHDGTTHSRRRAIRKSARARTLQPGDSLAILVDPERPRRMVLAELFDGG